MNKQKINTVALPSDEMHKSLFMAFAALLLTLSSDQASAALSVISSVLCSAYGLIYYDIGRGLATLAIVSLGIGAMLGRVTWGQAVTVCAGIGTVFGALSISLAIIPFSVMGITSSTVCGFDGTAAAFASSLSSAACKVLPIACS